MASTMTRTDTTDEGATILAGGSKKDGGVAVRRTAVAYLWILQRKISNSELKKQGRIYKNRDCITVTPAMF